jgi:hypothetical protein
MTRLAMHRYAQEWAVDHAADIPGAQGERPLSMNHDPAVEDETLHHLAVLRSP